MLWFLVSKIVFVELVGLFWIDVLVMIWIGVEGLVILLIVVVGFVFDVVVDGIGLWIGLVDV